MTIFIVITVVALAALHMFSHNDKWQNHGVEVLRHKVESGLAQIHGQWASEGKPEQIVFQPRTHNQAITISLHSDGRPKIDINPHSCRKFLNWFIDGSSIDRGVSISSDLERSCNFKVAQSTFAYQLSDDAADSGAYTQDIP
ncbi:hypothetical protein PN836_015505 [Ningiella sp. W23]|uniref:hypothetical protein n=1 Tax=Ningiella sp. W23 TaxID=3023715 RepID=UPI0037570A95